MSPSARSQEVVLVRHGETEWSRASKHTGRTDIPLTDRGARQAQAASSRLAPYRSARVLTSPLQRASETCRRVGFGGRAELCPELLEWDYGDYEGMTTAEIRRKNPGWSLWRDGAPRGERPDDVRQRVDRLIQTMRLTGEDYVLFAHGHVLRVLGARWLGLAAGDGRLFTLVPAAVCVLGWERGVAVFNHWNDDSHLQGLMIADDDGDGGPRSMRS